MFHTFKTCRVSDFQVSLESSPLHGAVVVIPLPAARSKLPPAGAVVEHGTSKVSAHVAAEGSGAVVEVRHWSAGPAKAWARKSRASWAGVHGWLVIVTTEVSTAAATSATAAADWTPARNSAAVELAGTAAGSSEWATERRSGSVVSLHVRFLSV